nr:hypothetical protein [Leptolyngbya sp. 7M]
MPALTIPRATLPANQPRSSHAEAIRQDTIAYLEHLAQQGDYLRIPFAFSLSAYFINDAEAVQEILLKQARKVQPGPDLPLDLTAPSRLLSRTAQVQSRAISEPGGHPQVCLFTVFCRSASMYRQFASNDANESKFGGFITRVPLFACAGLSVSAHLSLQYSSARWFANGDNAI